MGVGVQALSCEEWLEEIPQRVGGWEAVLLPAGVRDTGQVSGSDLLWGQRRKRLKM